MPGATLGRFRLDVELGEGGHGVVWRAKDTLLGEDVALKVLRPEFTSDHEAVERLRREVVLARRVSHPGVCRVYDLHEIDGVAGGAGFLVLSMQLLDGEDLSTILYGPRLPTARALRIIDGIADATVAAHAANVIHRDLKPSNVIVDTSDRVFILDFGIAAASDLARLTQPGVVVGTLRFIAPEVLKSGKATALSDQYALGIIAWALLAGRLPFDKPQSAIALIDMVEKGPPNLRAIDNPPPSQVVGVIERAMHKDPTRRFASVADFQSSLRRAAAASTTGRRIMDVSDSIPTVSRPEATQIVRRDALPTGFTGVQPVAKSRVPMVAAALTGMLALVVIGVVVAQVTPTPTSTPPVPSPVPSTVTAHVESVPPPVPQSDVPQADVEPVPDELAVLELPTHKLKPTSTVPKPAPTSTTATAEESSSVSSLNARARALGLRRDDVPAWDAAIAAATAAKKKGDPSGDDLIKRAAEVLAGVKIDDAFINNKVARFNAASDAALKKDPDKKAVLKEPSRAIAQAMKARDPVATNRALNAAFEVLRP